MLVVDHDDLLNRRLATLRRVFRFLGVDETFTSPRFEAVRNTARRHQPRSWLRRVLRRPHSTDRRAPRPQIDDDLRRSLVERFFAEEVARLREQTGQRFESWRV